MNKKEWWHPQPVNVEWFARLRHDYPHDASMSDDELVQKYNNGWDAFVVTWDNLKDAREEYAALATDWLRMRGAYKSARATIVARKKGGR